MSTGWAIGFELFQIGAAIPDLRVTEVPSNSIRCGAHQPLIEPLQVNFPATNLEIEIVLTIMSGGSLLTAGRCGWILLRKSLKRLK